MIIENFFFLFKKKNYWCRTHYQLCCRRFFQPPSVAHNLCAHALQILQSTQFTLSVLASLSFFKQIVHPLFSCADSLLLGCTGSKRIFPCFCFFVGGYSDEKSMLSASWSLSTISADVDEEAEAAVSSFWMQLNLFF